MGKKDTTLSVFSKQEAAEKNRYLLQPAIDNGI
jgi:hypothetical protein